MNYSSIIEEVHNQLKRKNYSKGIIDNSFGICKDEEKLSILKDLYGTFSYWSSIYFQEDEELIELKDYQISDKIIDFFRQYEPKDLPYLGGGVRLLDLDGIKEENSNYSPSAYLIKYGLLTFAATIGGNVISMDLNELNYGEPRIVYIDKCWFNFDESERRVKCSRFSFNIDETGKWFSKKILEEYIPEVSKTFTEFLNRLATEDEWDLEGYYDKLGKKNSL